MDKPTVFISYSHLDEEWKNRLVRHLGVSQKQDHLVLWHDRLIGAGDDWEARIAAAMNAASVAVLLVSANSLTSDFILREEISRLLKRRASDGLRIFPIIIKPCDWDAVDWLRRMNLRPVDGKPLSGGTEHEIDLALTEIAKEIRQMLTMARTPSESPTFVPLPPDKISTHRLPVTGKDLFGRDAELMLLDDAWVNPSINVITFVAWGGVGKSALVNHWLRRMAKDQYRGAERVFAWSFYSQGTSDDRAASADLFIDATLRWFGDPDPTQGSPWDKGERLAALIRHSRTLLLLDGLEPLQHPPNRAGLQEGRLKDPALAACLRELAAHQPGLCVITTREQVGDLCDYEGGSVVRVDLDHLSPHAGAQILRAQGVVGDDDELERASAEFGGHSLALTLLGSYLKDVCDGDIRRRNEIGPLEKDVRHGGHARRAMASYEKWLGDGPNLAVLRMLGLFDRPAEPALIDALRAAPAIPGLTDALQSLTEREWRQTLARLRRIKLLADTATQGSDVLDAHPLVREHFGAQLKQHLPDAWREANNRLYEHLTHTAKEFPDTIDEMVPLFTAVAHGCEAGRHQEALVEVHWKRIQRGEEHFNWKTLGAFGADLALLSNFFATPWQQPVVELTEVWKPFVLSEAGSDLHAVGRLQEAAQSMQAALEARISQKNWIYAAINAGNLSSVNLTIGNLPQALTFAQQSVELADRSGDGFEQMNKRTTLADALHLAGQLADAEAAFREAEDLQKEQQPACPILYSLWGFRYCDLLLEQGKYLEVKDRAVWTLEIAKSNRRLLDTGLDNLSLGRAWLLQVRQEGGGATAQSTDFLRRAVDGLRQAGHQEFIARGLLARAELHRLTGNYARAQADLAEAHRIAERGEMGLHLCDCHLEWARLDLAQGNRDQAREHWATAKAMVERMGYHRRDRDVVEIEQELG